MSELRFPLNDRDHIVGPADAPVTLVEYGDYQCLHCQAAWPQVELVLRRFGRDLRYAYRHFPISTVHPLAKPAAECAEFAGAPPGSVADVMEEGYTIHDRLLRPARVSVTRSRAATAAADGPAPPEGDATPASMEASDAAAPLVPDTR